MINYKISITKYADVHTETCELESQFELTVSTINTLVKTTNWNCYTQCGSLTKQWNYLKCLSTDELESAVPTLFKQSCVSIAFTYGIHLKAKTYTWLLGTFQNLTVILTDLRGDTILFPLLLCSNIRSLNSLPLLCSNMHILRTVVFKLMYFKSSAIIWFKYAYCSGTIGQAAGNWTTWPAHASL